MNTFKFTVKLDEESSPEVHYVKSAIVYTGRLKLAEMLGVDPDIIWTKRMNNRSREMLKSGKAKLTIDLSQDVKELQLLNCIRTVKALFKYSDKILIPYEGDRKEAYNAIRNTITLEGFSNVPMKLHKDKEDNVTLLDTCDAYGMSIGA